MNRDGRHRMAVDDRVGLLETELTEHEDTVAEQIHALRTDMKSSQAATNRLLFGILVVLLTVLGGLITALATAAP